jgi:hypothetical protein
VRAGEWRCWCACAGVGAGAVTERARSRNEKREAVEGWKKRCLRHYAWDQTRPAELCSALGAMFNNTSMEAPLTVGRGKLDMGQKRRATRQAGVWEE